MIPAILKLGHVNHQILWFEERKWDIDVAVSREFPVAFALLKSYEASWQYWLDGRPFSNGETRGEKDAVASLWPAWRCAALVRRWHPDASAGCAFTSKSWSGHYMVNILLIYCQSMIIIWLMVVNNNLVGELVVKKTYRKMMQFVNGVGMTSHIYHIWNGKYIQ